MVEQETAGSNITEPRANAEINQKEFDALVKLLRWAAHPHGEGSHVQISIEALHATTAIMWSGIEWTDVSATPSQLRRFLGTVANWQAENDDVGAFINLLTVVAKLATELDRDASREVQG